ncbi:MAG: alkaline phosphatase D family protein, partial [Polyangiales bacterium]
PQILRNEGCKRVLYVGDQMYADFPSRRSLFDPAYFARVSPGPTSILECSRNQVRDLYHQRYRLFWNFDAWQSLMAGWAGHFMWDDHEIVDNFGCAFAHGADAWANVRLGATDACYNYEMARSVPRSTDAFHSFNHGFRYGPVATFMLDLRSQKRRHGDDRVDFYSETQLRDLETFLSTHADAPVMLLVLTVPILHLPDWIATIGATLSGEASDAEDRWSHAWAATSRDRLLRTLHAHQNRHPHQKLVLVGGDIHVGAMSEIEWSDGTRPILQLTSSAITHRDSLVVEKLAELTPRIPFHIDLGDGLSADTQLLAGHGAASSNPYGGLNFAVVQFATQGSEVGVHFKLFGDIDGDVKPVYSSAVL